MQKSHNNGVRTNGNFVRLNYLHFSAHKEQHANHSAQFSIFQNIYYSMNWGS